MKRLLAFLLAKRLRGRRRPLPPPDPTEKEVQSTAGAEWAVVVLLLGVALAGFAFGAVYLADGSTQLYGVTLGGAFCLLAAALGVAAKRVVPHETRVEPFEIPHEQDEHEQEEADERVASAAEGVTRRKAIAGAAGVAGVGLGAALVAPAASLGPNVGSILDNTPWQKGRYLVDEQGKRISADEFAVGDFVTAFPEKITGERRERADVPVVLVRLETRELQLTPERQSWAPEGFVAYSQICTHAGCAVSMFRYPLSEPTSHPPALVCPCHYSTFDPRRGAKVTFGPAGRPLPQLPLAIDSERHLHATGGLSGAPGPSWSGVKRRET
jgi:ubiquinol-cytochrome c reductase iron-sulfur subunit